MAAIKRYPTLKFLAVLLFLAAIVSCSVLAEPAEGCFVHFIDVGQADSILITIGRGALLIDGGNNADADRVIRYIRAQGINRLDYVIGTHPHEDHIGGLDRVIRSFDVGKVMLPNVPHNTRTFEDLLLAVAARGLKITAPRVHAEYPLDEGRFTVLAPHRAVYEDLNDYSLVIRLVYGKTAFLLTGDAETVSEAEMVADGLNLEADVLKVGHHGSRSSTTQAFLDRVNPAYAVISVGKDNDYGHPAAETLARLTNAGVKVYRTDRNGTIVIASNGSVLHIQAEKGAADLQAVYRPDELRYIGNINSKKFHRPTCNRLPVLNNRKYFQAREDAVKEGYTPCDICKP